MARKYSLGEIDRMRDDVAWMRSNRDPDSNSFPAKPESVEEELRTLMGAGIGAAELHSQRTDREARIAYIRDWEWALTENRQRDCPHTVWRSAYTYCGLTYPSCACPTHYYGSGKSCYCQVTKYCAGCELRERRHKKQGRPGGRRASDKLRVEKAKTEDFLSDPVPAATIVAYGDPKTGKTSIVPVAVPSVCKMACCDQRRPWWRFW